MGWLWPQHWGVGGLCFLGDGDSRCLLACFASVRGGRSALFSGLKRRSREPELYRGKIAGYVLTTLSVLILGLFGFVVYQVSRAFPDAKNAPQIGQRAPEFSLVDANGKNFTLAQLLSTPITNSGSAARATKGVLVVFYRGYW